MYSRELQYVGSKRRKMKKLFPIFDEYMPLGGWYVEPFLGSASLAAFYDYPNNKKIINDAHTQLMAMWQAVVFDNWKPPTNVSREQYFHIRANKSSYPDHLLGFVGFACAYGGEYFGPYAKNAQGTNYAKQGANSVLKKAALLQGVTMYNVSYEDLPLPAAPSLIYCDPPYQNARRYYKKVKHADFFEWCRNAAAAGHTILLSEYAAPDDFVKIAEFPHKAHVNHSTLTGNTFYDSVYLLRK